MFHETTLTYELVRARMAERERESARMRLVNLVRRGRRDA
jgi:hypothetical protein